MHENLAFGARSRDRTVHFEFGAADHDPNFGLRRLAPRATRGYATRLETSQEAGPSGWSYEGLPEPWIHSNRPMSAKVTATLPSLPFRIWHRHDPLTLRHGLTAAHTRAVHHHPPVPRRAPHGMPTTRAPAGPRPRQVAWAGGRAMHLTLSPTAESTRGDTFGGPRARPLSESGGRCRRRGVPMGSRWAARGRYFVRVAKVRGVSGAALSPV